MGDERASEPAIATDSAAAQGAAAAAAAEGATAPVPRQRQPSREGSGGTGNSGGGGGGGDSSTSAKPPPPTASRGGGGGGGDGTAASAAAAPATGNSKPAGGELVVATGVGASGEEMGIGSPQGHRGVVEATLLRLTSGMAQHELRTVVEEADAVEELLLHEIDVLEAALEGCDGGNRKTNRGRGGERGKNPAEDGSDGEPSDGDLRSILDACPFTPLDGYWTVSALLGRLRGPEMAIPPSPMPHGETLQPSTGAPNPNAATGRTSANEGDSQPRQQQQQQPPPSASQELEEARGLLELEDHRNYAQPHDDPSALLALHKKLALHRSSSVFKKPVKVEDAPGYDTRILFPVDLALVRKQIAARQVSSYRDLHQRIGMIAYNCCKYNGRESDYGHVAREFEQVGDELIRQAVLQLSPSSRQSTPVAGVGGGGGRSSSMGGGGGGGFGPTTATAAAAASSAMPPAAATTETSALAASSTASVPPAAPSSAPDADVASSPPSRPPPPPPEAATGAEPGASASGPTVPAVAAASTGSSVPAP